MRRRPRSARHLLLLAAIGVTMLALGVPNVAPAIRAARADGVHGTFVAERLRCVQHPGHELCSWYGTFRPDPTVSGASPTGDVRTAVALYGSDRDLLRAGVRVPAVDIGRPAQVYPPSGSREWMVVTVLVATGCVLVAPLIVAVAVRILDGTATRRATARAGAAKQ